MRRPSAPLPVTLLLASLLGLTWGTASICALGLGAGPILAVTDAWWSWAAVLAASAMLSRRLLANLLAVPVCGAWAIGSYYLLKAAWSVGYPSRSDGFWDHLEAAPWAPWMVPVLVAAVPAALVGTAIRRATARLRVTPAASRAVSPQAGGR
ncbi:hypothetical protein [Brachybacterium hainanense]|uniref:Uncharacterized protein n=1 Tax=Brachybacterium hainanense TaxID=1541174 RepID=A0ABV6R9U7_9MICO